MARGFGSTDGAGTTDKIVTNYTACHTLNTWSVQFWLTGAGGGGFGRLFDKGNPLNLLYDNAAGKISFGRLWTTTSGTWTIAAPATGGWNNLCITYDGGLTTNVPIFYLNGTTPTVTAESTPVGTLSTDATVYTIGNRADNIRHLNGRLANPAHWDRIASASEALAITSGISPAYFRNNLKFHYPLIGRYSPEWDDVAGAVGTVTGTLVQPHPRIFNPWKPVGLAVAPATSIIPVLMRHYAARR